MFMGKKGVSYCQSSEIPHIMKAAGAVFVVKNPKKGTFPLVPARLRRLKLVCVVA